MIEIREFFEQQGFSEVAKVLYGGRKVLGSDIPAVRDELEIESNYVRVSEHMQMLKG
jgi:hypothetical protein